MLLSASDTNDARARDDKHIRDGVLQVETEASEEPLSLEPTSSPAQVLLRKLDQK